MTIARVDLIVDDQPCQVFMICDYWPNDQYPGGHTFTVRVRGDAIGSDWFEGRLEFGVHKKVRSPDHFHFICFLQLELSHQGARGKNPAKYVLNRLDELVIERDEIVARGVCSEYDPTWRPPGLKAQLINILRKLWTSARSWLKWRRS